WSVRGLGEMPDIARLMGVGTIAIVPYYYVPDTVGMDYANVLREKLGCPAFSWQGFHHDRSGVDFDEFLQQLKRCKESLKEIQSYPYMDLSDEEYRTWFADATTPIGPLHCNNVERLADIQPNGEVNFCVDFPDYVIGNARDSSLGEIWNGERARRFREYRRTTPLPVCYRCGAKFMSGP
ncbi:MAG: SPASM domain-containing protein, partial [Lentisphaerota bacterium]